MSHNPYLEAVFPTEILDLFINLIICVVLTYCLQAGRSISSHLVHLTSTNKIATSINLTYGSLNWSAHRGRRWCSRHHALPWGQIEHATFASIAQRSVLYKVMDDSAHLADTCCISWLPLLFFILYTASFLAYHFSFNIIPKFFVCNSYTAGMGSLWNMKSLIEPSIWTN